MAPKYMFEFEPYLAIQQIPLVQDVLYTMRLQAECVYFLQGMRDSPRYIANMGLLIAEAATEFPKIRPNKTDPLDLVLSRLILEMCPPEARCLHVKPYVLAAIRAGVLKKNVLCMSPLERRTACNCWRCNEPQREL